MGNQYQTITAIEAAQTQEALEAVAVRVLLERICNKSALHVFFAALSLVSSTKYDTTLHFDSIVLCYSYSLGDSTLNNLEIVSLKFTNSVLHHQTLEDISSMFAKIGRLTLDTCCILMDDPFQLNIHLPFTELAELELNISSFVNATNWSPRKKQIYSTCCSSLENLYLLRAVSEDGHFMVKIETQDKTHVFHKQGAGDIKRSCMSSDRVKSNAFNFVIWIECKQLKEVRLRGENGLKWDTKLE